jgi:hypothetical protein
VEPAPVVNTLTNSTSTSTKANKAPKKNAPKTEANVASRGHNASKEEGDAATELVNNEAKDAATDIQSALGETVQDPAVAGLLKQAEQAAADGTPLPAGWQQQFENAVNSSTFGSATAGFAQKVQDFVNIQLANVVLAAGCDPHCNCYPTGMCECIMMPCLPTDDFCWVRENCCMIGTGGEGHMGVVTCDANELIDEPMGAGEPVAETTLDFENAVDSGLLIINPEENDTDVSFTLEGKSYTLKPGYHQNFPEGDSWQVRFDKGGSQGDARYTVEPGTYVFTPEDGGWNLYRRTIEVSIENNSDSEFNYVAGDEQQSLKSGEGVEHSSAYPLFIRFDPGNGKDSVKRFAEKKTELAVAIDPKKGQFDLFAADQVAKSDGDQAEDESSSSRISLFEKAGEETTSAKSGSRSSRLLALMNAKSKSKSP